MEKSTLVSIIMPSFNSEKTIQESIESIISQTYNNWELLITDDCSDDRTVDLINKYIGMDSRISLYVLTSNSGAGVARNNSITQSKGRFIAFLDADDLWLETKLDIQVKFMIKNNAALSYTYYKKFTSLSEGSIVKCPDVVNYNKLLFNNVIGCLTAMYDTTIVGKCYMPLIRKRQDFGLWLSILAKGYDAQCVRSVLAKYRTDTGMTRNKFIIFKHQWDFYRNILGFSLAKSLYVFLFYAYYGFKKYIL